MKTDVFTAIRINYNSLSEVQRRIADFVLKNGNTAMFLSITDLAQKCETSETTIMRFLRKVGFSSYQVFRVELAQGLQQDNPRYAYSDIDQHDSVHEVIEKVVSSTVTAIEDIRNLVPAAIIEKAADWIEEAEQILIFGVGSSGYIAGDLFHKLIRLGINAVVCHDPHIMAIHSAQTKKGNLVICVSHSGESEVILDCAREGKQRGSRLVAMTSYPHSSLAETSDLNLFSSTSETNYRPDAMTSRILQLVIIDLLSIVLTLRKGKVGIDAIGRSQVAVARQKR